MSDDLIKRSDAIKALEREKSDWNNDYNVPIDNCIKRLNKVKSADRPQGEWIDTSEWYAPRQKCSICETIVVGYGSNFCPNCGCRMKGADDERS